MFGAGWTSLEGPGWQVYSGLPKGRFPASRGHSQDTWYQVPFLSYHQPDFATLSQDGFTASSQHLEAGGLIPIYRRAN